MGDAKQQIQHIWSQETEPVVGEKRVQLVLQEKQ